MANFSRDNKDYNFKTSEFKHGNEILTELYSNMICQITAQENYKHCKRSELEDYKKLQQELEEAKVVHHATNEKVKQLEKELEDLQKETREKNKAMEIKMREKENLEKQFTLLSNSQVSSHDMQKKEETKLRYKCLRNITQVRFSFEKSDSNKLEGFAFNDVNKKVKCFSIPNLSELTQEQISEKILASMEECSAGNYADIPLE